jgi:16S rRNA (guanine966-N2)-methyltransferase
MTLRVPELVTRPTADRVREAVFSILGERVVGAGVLDLYAGSGALGIEALSRGARSAEFVEQSAKAAQVIEANLRATGLAGGGVRCLRVESFLTGAVGRGEAYDLIFADPPYKKRSDDPDIAAQLLLQPGLSTILAVDGILSIEVPAGKWKDEDVPADWSLLDRRVYGGTEFLFLRGRKEES